MCIRDRLHAPHKADLNNSEMYVNCFVYSVLINDIKGECFQEAFVLPVIIPYCFPYYNRDVKTRLNFRFPDPAIYVLDRKTTELKDTPKNHPAVCGKAV